ncbi:DUF2322 family protein [Methylovorus glucosotrophus]|uniref:RNA polymerase factor sigma-32 n=1 Tax=Methylovorus glucosotrophus (strain SIP3-4) TaxID=582744 RepID=C6X965_METGS|nr:DUF2322 family protein [Methylovorus glucosotrophus]ACT49685.1 conserved hypothetical protein [Methylovorus glucosotrophus SIP3-4]
MKPFSEILSTLASADHIQSIALYTPDQQPAGLIENKPGSQGSLKVYQHLLKKHGAITPAAAQEGLELYAEHTADAKAFPGKHPNIDRLLDVVSSQHTLTAKVTE